LFLHLPELRFRRVTGQLLDLIPQTYYRHWSLKGPFYRSPSLFLGILSHVKETKEKESQRDDAAKKALKDK
jgi:hypothetical protein